ncbi:MAG TPA: lycopene beta-cyclase CrtY [Caulobacter sp.]|nr:lycopene beta-cyclase CrtY [Caulobacter sp.]
MASPNAFRADVVLVGGGLANGLIALRLRALRPELRVILLEGETTFGGRHTWSHFASDVSPEIGSWLAPLIAHRWDGYEVRFPTHRRVLSTPYLAAPSERFHAVLSAALGEDGWTGAAVARLDAGAVLLTDGRRVTADCVIDGRGPAPAPSLALGWQKFLGLEVELTAPHGLTRPIVMDATVDQLDGYRFLYCLPFSATRLLIEDTRYSDGHGLDRDALAAAIEAYAASQGWTIDSVVRQETGILPIALAGDIDAYWRAADTARVGLRAALFHPVTGYSLPDAARLADEIAALPVLSTATVRACVEARSKQRWRERAYYRLLNRMLFRAAEPGRRYRVLERFYRLRQDLVERFYAGRITLADKARVLIGKPPVPIAAALAVLSEQSVLSGDLQT